MQELLNLKKVFLDFSENKPTQVFNIDDTHGYRVVSYNSGIIKSKMVIRNLSTQQEFIFTVFFKIMLKSSVKE